MEHLRFGLLELGSNSLKFYLVRRHDDADEVKTHKWRWSIAHELFRHGYLADDAVAGLVAALRSVEDVSEGVALHSMLAVATGVFRELRNQSEIVAHLLRETGVRVRVISAADEASLMSRAFLREARQGNHLLFDLGGASTEYVGARDGVQLWSGSLPLGAIRNEHMFRHLRGNPADYLRCSAEHCDLKLEAIPRAGELMVSGTGGTVRAVAAVAGAQRVSIAEIRRSIHEALEPGPPAPPDTSRRSVLLPGLIILERILVRAQATTLEVAQTSVRDGLADRLRSLLRYHRTTELHATLLLATRPPRS